MAAVILGIIGPGYLGVRHDPVPAKAADILDRFPAAVGIGFEELLHAGDEFLYHIWTNGVIEHGCRADLDRTAAEQEIVECLREVRDPADAREALLGECLCKRRHLCHSLRQDGGTAEAAARYISIDIHFELEGLRIDKRQGRESIGRRDRIGAAAKDSLGLDYYIRGRRDQLSPDRNFGHFFNNLG